MGKQRGGEERQTAAGVPADPQAAADPEGHLALPAHRRRHLQRAQSAAAGFPQPVRPPAVRPRPRSPHWSWRLPLLRDVGN